MRSLDSAYNHAPLYRAEFLDSDGMLVEVHLVDEAGKDELMRNWELHGPGPSACAFRIVSLNGNLDDESCNGTGTD